LFPLGLEQGVKTSSNLFLCDHSNSRESGLEPLLSGEDEPAELSHGHALPAAGLDVHFYDNRHYGEPSAAAGVTGHQLVQTPGQNSK